MRHGIAGNTLNRKTSHRKATVRDIAKAALIQQRICTTKAKAKEARKLVDQLITLGKKGGLAEKRRAFAILCDHGIVSHLFRETSQRFQSRPGGYTRIITANTREGDNAQMVYLELTEKKEIIVSKPTVPAKKAKEAVVIEDKKKETSVAKGATPPATAQAKEHHDPKQKKDAIKTDTHLTVTDKDKAKHKNIVGGIRKMFNRKSSGK